MALSIANVLADLETVTADAQKAVPALQAFLGIVDKIKPLLPTADQVLVNDAEAAINVVISVLSKV